MKRSILIFALLFALTLTAAPAFAAFPDDGVFIPIQDSSYWAVGVGADNVPFGDDAAWVDAQVGDDGVLTLRRSAQAEVNWPNIRTVKLGDDSLFVNLRQTPYLYYDFTLEGAAGARWALGMTLEDAVHLSFGPLIVQTAGPPATIDGNDGSVGVFKGVIDMNDYLRTAPEVSDSDRMIAPPDATLLVTDVQIYIIDSGTSATLTFNALYFGGENEDTPPVVTPVTPPVIATEENATPPPAVTLQPPPDEPGGVTTATEKPTLKPPETPDIQDGNDGNNGDPKPFNYTLFVIVPAGVVLAAGIAAYLLLRKKPETEAAAKDEDDHA